MATKRPGTHSPGHPDFAGWLEAARAKHHPRLTWKALAEQVGCSHAQLLEIKNGKVEPSRALRQKLEQVLSLPVPKTSRVPRKPELAQQGEMSLEDLLESIWAEVPAAEWDKLPADGATEHDHYIYGTPKRSS